MQIFILDTHPTLSAQMLCDKHVVKQCLESAQILSTLAGGPYKPTHPHHPCVLWAGACITNYNWLLRHAKALCMEYTLRYGRKHKCEDVIYSIRPPRLPVGITPFVQCMPPEYQDKDPVQAYRKYYRGDKARFAKWTKRDEPFWWRQEC